MKAEDRKRESDEYLAFSIAGETFALEIDRSREVVDCMDVTEVPGMPACLPGVFNLRGGIVSVIDVRRMLGVVTDSKREDGCIIILEIDMDGELVTVGAPADEVRGVVRFDPESILPPPEIGTNIGKDFVRGVGKRDGEFVFILDIEKIIVFIESEIQRERNVGSDRRGIANG